VLALGAAALVLAACASGSPLAASNTTGAPTNPKAEVLAAYRGMWSDLVTAARTSDYQSPLLADHATGSALTLFVQGLARDQLRGIVTTGEPVLDPSVTSLLPSSAPTHATVTDCFDDTHWVEFTTSGTRAKNASAGRRATTALLTEQAGSWKVTQLTVRAVGTC
jgi:hypothetical protein